MDPKCRILFCAIQRWRATAARGKILSLFQWCRKKYLSTIMALAIALSCLFGPLLALPANANASNDIAPNGDGGLVTKIRETPAIEVGSPLLETDGEEQCEMIENGKTAVVEEDQEDMADSAGSSTPSKPSTLSGGSNTGSEMKDATKEVEQHVEPETKTRQSTAKRSRVVAVATATGGGAFLLAKNRISKDGNDDEEDEVGVDEERIETTRKVPSTTKTTQSLPLCDPVHRKAREEQPKSPAEEASLAARYAQISDVGERAFQILVDLGMIELHE